MDKLLVISIKSPGTNYYELTILFLNTFCSILLTTITFSFTTYFSLKYFSFLVKFITSFANFIKINKNNPAKYSLYLKTKSKTKNTISKTAIGLETRLNKNDTKLVLLNTN